MSYRTLLGTAAVAICLSPTVFAAPETYALDGTHTHIVWSVDRFGFTQTIATFPDVSGTLVLDEDDPQASTVTAEIGVASVRSDLARREEVIRSGFWLNAELFPTITFATTGVTQLSENTATLDGELTVMGQTRPVTLDVTLNKIGTDPVTKKKAAGFSARGSINRSDFGLETALGPVGDKVSIHIEALAIAAD